MGVIVGQVVDDTGLASMHLPTTEFLSGDDLTRGGTDQRRPAEENRPFAADDDGFVAHGRDVRPARRARAHNGRELRDARLRHSGLVEEDPAEVVPVRENLVLQREISPAGIDQVTARQPERGGNFLRPEVLFHCYREVRAAFYCRVIGDHHAVPSLDLADAGHQTR